MGGFTDYLRMILGWWNGVSNPPLGEGTLEWTAHAQDADWTTYPQNADWSAGNSNLDWTA